MLDGNEGLGQSPLLSIVLLGALTLLPFVFMTTTSFVKISVVFSILRNALGTGQVPSGMVISALAAILSLYVMAPVGEEMIAAAAPATAQIDTANPLASADALFEAVELGFEPLRQFLERNSGRDELVLFRDLRRQSGSLNAADVTEHDVLVVLPSFVITELSEAFQIGFLIFLPFLVIDMVVANVLLALGVRDVSDVPSVFAGANRYALEQGFAGGIPTFDTLSDGDRTAIGVIVVLFEHGYPLELPGPEITPRCSGSPFCPLETTCGGLGQACCQSFCEAGVQCTFHGLESSRNCLLPPPLTAVFCGNGRCEAGEPCSCPDDCGNSCTICLPSRLAAYCVTCPGELPRTTFFTDCDDPHVDGCTVRRGICR